MRPDYPHKLFNDDCNSYICLMEALATDGDCQCVIRALLSSSVVNFKMNTLLHHLFTINHSQIHYSQYSSFTIDNSQTMFPDIKTQKKQNDKTNPLISFRCKALIM